MLNASGTSQAADALIAYGALLLHDSRVSEEDNSTFLDLIEDYFAQSEELLKKDERPELGYQATNTLAADVIVPLTYGLPSGWRDAGEHGEAQVRRG